MTRSTIEAYDGFRRLALTGTRSELMDLRLIEQLNVLVLRHLLDPATLGSMDGRDAFAFGVDAGLIGEQGVRDAGLGTISVDGDEATARALDPAGEETILPWSFLREDGTWHLNLVPTFDVAELVLEESLAESGQTPVELVEEAVRASAQGRLPADLWAPPEG